MSPKKSKYHKNGKNQKNPRAPDIRTKSLDRSEKSSNLYIYGKHPVLELGAIKSAHNRIINLFITLKNLEENPHLEVLRDKISILNNQEISEIIANPDVNHQGFVAHIKPKAYISISSLKEDKNTITQQATIDRPHDKVLILDNIDDFHNIGALMRSAVAFGARAIFINKKYEVLLSPTIYKTSAGMIEHLDIIGFNNLRQALEELKQYGYWIIGLDGEAQTPIKQIKDYKRIALVLGSEGKGMRRLSREDCDILAAIPISNTCESLNVAVAGAIALYELNQS